MAELPFGPGKRLLAGPGLASALTRNWQVNGVFSSFTGTPFTVGAAAASLNAPGNTQTADQVKPTVTKLGGVGRESPFYDPEAFQAVTAVRYGTSGRNILRGPGVVNFDLSIYRTFPLTERLSMQFRAEAFNATNTPHFNNPAASVSVPASFMRITSARTDERQFRFGLRLAF